MPQLAGSMPRHFWPGLPARTGVPLGPLCLSSPAELGEYRGQVIERAGEVGAIAVEAGGGQFPVHGDGLLGHRQSVARPAHLPEPDSELGQGVTAGAS